MRYMFATRGEYKSDKKFSPQSVTKFRRQGFIDRRAANSGKLDFDVGAEARRSTPKRSPNRKQRLENN